MSFQVFKEFNVDDDYIQGSEEDVDYNQNLKAISQIYLTENGFSLGNEKLVENMSREEFVKTMEERSEESSELVERFEKNEEIQQILITSNTVSSSFIIKNLKW